MLKYFFQGNVCAVPKRLSLERITGYVIEKYTPIFESILVLAIIVLVLTILYRRSVQLQSRSLTHLLRGLRP